MSWPVREWPLWTGLLRERKGCVLTMTPRIVGWFTQYSGSAQPEIIGRNVRIVCVRKILPSPDEPLKITSNDELAALGGLQAHDRVDISPTLANGDTGPDVFTDIALQDLACFPVILEPWVLGSHVG
jgi:hypothetical protein